MAPLRCTHTSISRPPMRCVLDLGDVVRHVVHLAQLRRDPRVGKDACQSSRARASPAPGGWQRQSWPPPASPRDRRGLRPCRAAHRPVRGRAARCCGAASRPGSRARSRCTPGGRGRASRSGSARRSGRRAAHRRRPRRSRRSRPRGPPPGNGCPSPACPAGCARARAPGG